MFSVSSKGLEQALANLTDLERRQLPFATALALTRTAQVVAQDIRAEMSAVFDRPTPATLNSLFIEPATKQKLEARVWIKDGRTRNGKGNLVGREGVWGKGRAASKWLTPEIFGGPRSHKAIDSMLRRRGILKQGQYIVPGEKAELDQYGNLSSGVISKILSGTKGYTEEGYKANATDSKKSKAKGNAKRYFVMHNSKREPFAIAERTEKGRNGIRVVMAFADRTPRYRKAIRFYEIADETAARVLPDEFRKAMAQAMATRRR
jgi:hypothetical protein